MQINIPIGKFGSLFTISRNQIWLMVNGRMFTVYRGLISGKLHCEVWCNIWRKTGEPLPSLKING